MKAPRVCVLHTFFYCQAGCLRNVLQRAVSLPVGDKCKTPAGGMLFAFLIVTPLHDAMITIASTIFLASIFYITVFVLKSKLHWFKFLCIACLLIFYYTLYLYGSGKYTLLQVMQKLTFASTIILVLLLYFFTKKENFEHLAPARQK